MASASGFRRIWAHPRARRLLVAALGVSLLALLAGFIAPYDPRTQDREAVKMPPHRLRFRDAEGRFHLRPFFHPWRIVDRARWRYEEDRSRRYELVFFVRGEQAPLFLGVRTSWHLFGVRSAPSARRAGVFNREDRERPLRFYLLGADPLGRDVFSRLVHGARPALLIAALSLAGAFLIGFALGGLAGYYGGIGDAALMRIAELVESVPILFLLLAWRAALPLQLSVEMSLFTLVALFVLVSWAAVARITRGCVLSLKTQDFVLSALALGAGPGWILRRHLLPNALTPALIQATVMLPSFLLGEAALSFLGLGVPEPEPSWGNMLTAARDLSVLYAHPWLLAPGFAIWGLVLLFTQLGEAVRAASDPRYPHSAPLM